MQYFADTYEIHAVDPSSQAHGHIISALGRSFLRNKSVWVALDPPSASYLGSRFEPDLSYGPRRPIIEPIGARLPFGVADWAHAKSRGRLISCMGFERGTFDWKALHVWAHVPGVAYVLCIELDFSASTFIVQAVRRDWVYYTVPTTRDAYPGAVHTRALGCAPAAGASCWCCGSGSSRILVWSICGTRLFVARAFFCDSIHVVAPE